MTSTFPRVSKIDTFHNEFVCFVRVTAEDGAEGWGQTSTYNADITTEVFHRQIVPWALGEPADDIAAIVHRVERREHKYPGSYLWRALTGIDTALWDLAGKRAGKPVAALLGGKAGPIRAYASSMRRDITPEDEAERMKRLAGEKGFTAVKWRIGAECGQDVDQWDGRTEAIIHFMAKAMGPRIDKLVDANSGFSVSRAIAVGRMLEEHGVSHYEEPVPYWDLAATKQVSDALALDVTGGEQDCDRSAWAHMVATRAVDIVQPDIMYLGGMVRTMEVNEGAVKAGLPCTPHAANLSLVTLCTMHLLAAIPNAGKYLELSIEDDYYYPWQRGLFANDPFAVVDGHVTVSEEPGWGVTVNPDWLARAAHREVTLESYKPDAYNSLYDTQNLPGR